MKTVVDIIKECLDNGIKEYHYILLELKREFPDKTVSELRKELDKI